jgi:hypothetical protein
MGPRRLGQAQVRRHSSPDPLIPLIPLIASGAISFFPSFPSFPYLRQVRLPSVLGGHCSPQRDCEPVDGGVGGGGGRCP